DPAEPIEIIGEREDPPNVGQTPAIDRLVVIADEENPVRRRGQEERHPELCPVQVLCLVDEKVSATVAPPPEDGRVALEQTEAPGDEIVEVEAALGREIRLVRHECPGDRSRLWIDDNVGGDEAEVELQLREGGVEAAPAGRSDLRGDPPTD